MIPSRYLRFLAALLGVLCVTENAQAQRGRGGAARPAAGGGGMARPGGGGMTRPAMPATRPAMAQAPAMNRPNAGAITRPAGGNRPGGGLPGAGGNRPTPLPGPIAGGNRPGGGGLPGAGGNRPGGGGLPGAGGNRPTPLPGPIAGGNRPGGGGLPGGGGNRPTPLPGPIAGGNRPGGGGNRPGIGSGNIGSGNIGQIGNNQNVVNRPNFGGNTSNNININNINNNINNSYRGGNRNVNNNYGGGAWFGGGGYGSGYNRGPVTNNNFYRGGGYGRGWASPYYGSWYRGGWGGSGFWAGFGTGALTSFGLGALGSAFRYPGYGYGAYGYPAYGYSSMGIYDYFPTWGMSTYGAWGLAPVASSLLYSGYTNPYYQTVVAAQPAQTTMVYDYSQPINVTSAPPDPAATESTEQVFSSARDSFKAGDYQRALDLTDQVLKQTPNAPVVHEFRALTLFALKRYDEAAAVDYAVLSAGPGWNWSTLVGLYPDVETYTNQLRALEAYAQSNPGSASPQFLLGYHYLVEGHNDAAAAQFEKVTQLQPNESLSASFVKLLRKASEAPSQPPQDQVQAAAAPTNDQPVPTAPNPTQEQPETPPPPPASLVGTWKAQPAPDLSIALTLQADGKFTWQVDSKGQKETLTGQAGFKDSTLALLQAEGPPLVGKVSEAAAGRFVFTPAGAGDKTPGLTFTK